MVLNRTKKINKNLTMSPLNCNVSIKCNLIPLPAFSTPLRYSVHFSVHRTANYRQQLTKNYLRDDHLNFKSVKLISSHRKVLPRIV